MFLLVQILVALLRTDDPRQCHQIVGKVEMYDGDTTKFVAIDLGFGTIVRRKIRLRGIDAPEIRTKDHAEKARGFVSKRAAQSWIDGQSSLVLITSKHRGETAMDSFGRVLGTIAPHCGRVQSMGDFIITTHNAKKRE